MRQQTSETKKEHLVAQKFLKYKKQYLCALKLLTKKNWAHALKKIYLDVHKNFGWWTNSHNNFKKCANNF